jgi:drug/metabolite transporter (DMT)-like permease
VVLCCVGSAIVFVALLKQFVLKDTLKRYMWVGIALNCFSIVLVGLTAMMIDASTAAAAAGDAADAAAGGGADGADAAVVVASGGTAALGVALILMGAFVQSLQYVFEEKVMSSSEEDLDMAPTPPLLLVR